MKILFLITITLLLSGCFMNFKGGRCVEFIDQKGWAVIIEQRYNFTYVLRPVGEYPNLITASANEFVIVDKKYCEEAE